MDTPNKTNTPPVIGTQGQWIPNTGQDPAARIEYSRFYYDLPKITAGARIFVWPAGTEGFRRSGSATLGIHKFLGRNYVSVSEIHKEEAHIEMSGTFAGVTAKNNMLDLIDVLTSAGVKKLYVPGVFTRVQNVFAQDWDFPHDADDRTHSINYTITFVRTTVGPNVKARTQAALVSNIVPLGSSEQSANVPNRSERTVTVKGGATTLRGLASALYGDADKWRALVDLNGSVLADYNPNLANMDKFQLSLTRLPLGTVLRY